jgi:hypothetical protein
MSKGDKKMNKMPKTLEELAEMLSKRDGISYEEELAIIRDTAADMEQAFYSGSLDLAEQILREDLGLEPDYLDLFIF